MLQSGCFPADFDENLSRLNVNLPPFSKPVGLYKNVVVVGDLLYTSGHVPENKTGYSHVGRVGQELNVKEGKEAARQTGLAMLASIRKKLGTLNRARIL